MTYCQRCGQAVKHPHGLNLTHLEMALFLVLFAAYPRGISIDACEEALYRDRRDGGPVSARGITAVTKRSLTRKLETRGWMVDGGRGAREYHLRRVWEPISVPRRLGVAAQQQKVAV